ncbi:hypothetical protein SAMN05444392_102320 [Seinonella peptonophila]|uniref:Uncharacterized protein n=1 Tax=Seinonella peptonophila TaxID=112248 RepID=A0A1M4VEF4_9BACL|nr:hypothetical protein [Seinonella peptonophila]SHE67292.1 hypothetical protein SAMN05444392_102320 [Seinonella peptonophila]
MEKELKEFIELDIGDIYQIVNSYLELRFNKQVAFSNIEIKDIQDGESRPIKMYENLMFFAVLRDRSGDENEETIKYGFKQI